MWCSQESLGNLKEGTGAERRAPWAGACSLCSQTTQARQQKACLKGLEELLVEAGSPCEGKVGVTLGRQVVFSQEGCNTKSHSMCTFYNVTLTLLH